MKLTTSGAYNTALGYAALSANTTGGSNVAIGENTLIASTASNNTAVGAASLASDTSGSDNIAIGNTAAFSLTTGSDNVVLGDLAAYNNTVTYGNVVIGHNAFMDFARTADPNGYNTVIGYDSGRGVTTGYNNTIIGARIYGLSSSLTNNIIIADGSGNQRINVRSDGNVGLGVASAATKLQVAGVITPSSDATYNLGDSTLRFLNVYAQNGTIQTSDEREKKDIQDADLGLGFVSKLHPVSFRWNHGPDLDLHYGLIAQEAQKAIEESKPGFQNANTIVELDKNTNRFGLRYTELIAPVTKSIQELYSSSKTAREDLEKLKAENASLKLRLEKLERSLEHN